MLEYVVVIAGIFTAGINVGEEVKIGFAYGNYKATCELFAKQFSKIRNYQVVFNSRQGILRINTSECVTVTDEILNKLKPSNSGSVTVEKMHGFTLKGPTQKKPVVSKSVKKPVIKKDVKCASCEIYKNPLDMKTISDVFIRSAPNITAKVLGTLKKDATINVLGKYANRWYFVEFKGLAGFISSPFLTLNNCTCAVGAPSNTLMPADKPVTKTRSTKPVTKKLEKRTKPLDYIIVKKGDTLYRIARRHKINPIKIIRINKLKPPFSIQIGQILQLSIPKKQLGFGEKYFKHFFLGFWLFKP